MLHSLWTASTSLATLAGTCTDLADPADLKASWRDDCQCYRGIVWGIERWFEPGVGRILAQDLDFFPVDREQRACPLIIYAHPAQAIKTIGPACGPLYAQLVQPARTHGFSLASIEFRQPGRRGGRLGSQSDIVQACRWLQAHAEPLGVDRRSVFIVDHSHCASAQWPVLLGSLDRVVQQFKAARGRRAQAGERPLTTGD